MTQREKALFCKEIEPEISPLPRQKLQLLLAKFGGAVFADPQRTETTLRQLCPKAVREVDLLMTALRENIVIKLLNSPKAIPPELTVKQLSQQLQNDLFIAENYADWAVESWALALGIIQQPLPKHVPLASAQTPSSVPLHRVAKQLAQAEPSVATQTPESESSSLPLIGKFIIQDGLAIDTETHLTWCRFAYGQTFENNQIEGDAKKITWRTALEVAESFNQHGGYAGFSDWRLPTIEELKTLIDKIKGKHGRYIDEAVFPCDFQMFWATLPETGGGYEAWTVNFVNGITSRAGTYSGYAVRLVRKSRHKDILSTA